MSNDDTTILMEILTIAFNRNELENILDDYYEDHPNSDLKIRFVKYLIKTNNLRLHEDLISIRDNPQKYAGICEQSILTRYYVEILRLLMSAWPEFSGNPLFPVPHYKYAPRTAHSRAAGKNTMWSKKSKYGKARRRLLDWLIEQTE